MSQVLDIRERSRGPIITMPLKNDGKSPLFNAEQLTTGAILRIADGIERVADSLTVITEQRDMYKSRYERERIINKQLKQQIKELKNSQS